MVPLLFAAVLIASCAIALIDWRRGWLLAILCGVLQDPARKLTPGAPAIMTLSVIVVYAAVLISAGGTLQRNTRDLTRRFPNLNVAALVFFLFLLLAAITGVITFGVGLWRVPALSLLIYCVPVPAVILGYSYVRTDADVTRLFTFYAVLTSVALIGTPLEYLGVHSPALGMVAMPEGLIRHLPGVQIRILSGFYRAPDIMGWHAAMLAIVALTMAARKTTIRAASLWIGVAGWAFLNSVLSGRRKSVYTVAVFAIVFLWRYIRRMNLQQIAAVLVACGVVAGIIYKLAESEKSSVYAKGTVTSEQEVLDRLEGGLVETVRQFGIMGAGLGTATQGVRHITGQDTNVGWQEGGLGKLTIELGLPGLISAALLAWFLFRLIYLLTKFPDEPGSSQLIRSALFAIFIANVVQFLVSAQAYSDPILTLLTAFLLGMLLGTAAIEDRMRATAAATASQEPLTAPATA